MMIQLLRQPLKEIQAPWLVLPLFEGQFESLPDDIRETSLGGLITRLASRKELTASLAELTALHDVPGLSASSVLLVGLGLREKFDAGAAFSAGFAFAKRLSAQPRERVDLALPPSIVPSASGWLSGLVEGVIAGTRGPGLRKCEPGRLAFETLNFVTSPGESGERIRHLEQQIRRGDIVGQSVNFARDLTNTPPSEKTPGLLAERIRAELSDAGVEVQVWDEARIRDERFGGLLGVAAGSANPPSFVVLEYRRGGAAPALALVGKGVTFDSGGLSLKPSASMEDMKSDMTGAAVVAATMLAAARLSLPVNLIGYLALTENMIGGNAMKLGDVLTMRNGKTVEVMNTDAEGRLILADALSFAAESQPGHIVDLATLTGACMVALGPKIAGLFSNDEAFSQRVLSACRGTGERAWPLPLDDDFKEQLKSNVADLKNVGGKWGGAVTAAKFLEHFVDSKSWVHLDIAGPSWNETDNASRDAGGTGCFVRTLVTLLEDYPGFVATSTKDAGQSG